MLPDDYLEFLRHHDGGEGVSVFERAADVGPAEDVAPGNDHLDGLIVFGGDGRGEVFCFDDQGEVLVVPLIGDRDDAGPQGDFLTFTRRLADGAIFD